MPILDSLTPAVLMQGGAVSILTLMVVGIFRGWLVPASHVDRIFVQVKETLAVHEGRLADEKARGDEWRGAYQVEKERGDEQARQLTELLELAHTSTAVLESWRRTAISGVEGGGR